jgi:cupin fold WbuC family metalloprotein
VLTFDDAGKPAEVALLSDDPEADGNAARQVEIPPGAWHTLAVLSEEAVLYEVIDGYFDPATHKRFAPWAPSEADAEGAQAYLAGLIRQCGH